MAAMVSDIAEIGIEPNSAIPLHGSYRADDTASRSVQPPGPIVLDGIGNGWREWRHRSGRGEIG